MNSKIDRKRIFIFLAITFGITITAALVIFFGGGGFSNFSTVGPLANNLGYVIAFAPALANIFTRLITREGWSNTFLRPNLRRGWPFYLAAWLLPLVGIILGGVIYYLLFSGNFDLSMTFARQIGKISATDTLVDVISQDALEGLFISLFGMFVFIGEEFGWRAYLLPKLLPMGTRKAFLLVGVFFGVFHWPMILMGFHYGLDYWGAPIVGPLLFILIITPPSALFSWVTLRTGSVWPACIAHAANNAFFSLMIYFHAGKADLLIGPVPDGIVGFLGYFLLTLPIFLIPGALKPVEMTLSKNITVVDVTADHLMLDTVS